MAEEFKYDVFLNRSSTDKAVVRAVSERLRPDRLQVDPTNRSSYGVPSTCQSYDAD